MTDNQTFTIDSPTGHLCHRLLDGKTWPAEILKSNAKGGWPIKALIDWGENEGVLSFKADGTDSANPFYRLINAPEKLTVEGLAREARAIRLVSNGCGYIQPNLDDDVAHVILRLGHTINEDGTIEVAK